MKRLTIGLLLICYAINTSKTNLILTENNYLIDTREELTAEKFASLICKNESNNNNDTINSLSHYGLFQFGKSTLKQLNVDSFKINEIMIGKVKLSKDEQFHLFYKYMLYNNKILKDEIIKYDNKYINGVKISNAVILAGAHFAGAGGIKLFLKTNGIIDPNDGNITLSKYVKQFENYKL